ncbi:hypothetical protein B7P43_G09357 [Cryptotermes secundus]|uniref:Uncharacterized protein n=1 Tax=Cryptotermes secundus TaxID=105785 RepID=A0A2J7RNP2_9NEOP|nr:hypothetical protein B7P43_G09357 [Cryptotermes secundus]
MFRPKRDEVIGGWRKLHNEELHIFSLFAKYNDLREIGCSCMDWIDLAEDRDQWRALVNRIMNLWVP